MILQNIKDVPLPHEFTIEQSKFIELLKITSHAIPTNSFFECFL